MHLVLIAWLYVALMVAATEPNLVGSVLSFSFYGLLPAAIIAYIGTTGQRKKRRRLQEAAALAEPDAPPQPAEASTQLAGDHHRAQP